MLPRALSVLIILSTSALAPSGPRRHRRWCVPPPRVQVDRTRWTDRPEVTQLRQLMQQFHAPGAELEEACVEQLGARTSRCAQPALAAFFRALDGAVSSNGRAGVVVFGNSLIASDGVTGVVRERLVNRFGDGGRGMVLADRMASYGPRARTAQHANGWVTTNLAGLERPPAPVGLAGVIHVSDGPALSAFAVDGERVADVFWFEGPAAPALEWRCDGGPWIPIHHRETGPQVTRVRLPEESETFSLRARGAGVVSHGVALERGGGGVVLDVFGVPSADAELWLQADEEAFSTQLTARQPALVTVMLGANEAKRISWGRASRASTEESLTRLLERLRQAAPTASCLVVGPGDAVVGPGHDEPWRERSQLAAVIELERRVALAHGCAFLDLYQAMGGPGSLARLAEAGLVHDDLVHPRGRGLELLGQLIADALLRAYERGDWDSAPALPPSFVAARAR